MRHTTFWHDTIQPSIRAPLPGDLSCDVCIVGAGYSGLWAAHFLRAADPSLQIVIAESNHVGAGASGHNDGFILQTLGGHTTATLAQSFGRERAMSTCGALRQSAIELCRFCINRGVDADIEASGIYSVATTRRQLRRLAENAKVANELGASYDAMITGANMRDRISSPAILGAYWHAGAVVNPFKLAVGLADVVTSDDVRIYEGTTVTEVTEDATGVDVVTPRGRIFAQNVILATDAYRPLHAGLAQKIRRYYRYIAVTEEISAWRHAIRWPRREGFVDVGRPSIFCRLTWDNRILLGGGVGVPVRRGDQVGGSGHGEVGRRVEAQMSALIERFFPMLNGIRMEYLYGGVIGVTSDKLPHVGQASPRVAYVYGYSGHGIVASHAAGKALRDLTLGRRTQDSALVFVNGSEPRFSRRAVSLRHLAPMRLLPVHGESRQAFG